MDQSNPRDGPGVFHSLRRPHTSPERELRPRVGRSPSPRNDTTRAAFVILAPMKEYLAVCWNMIDAGGAKVALRILARCDLRHLAYQEMDEFFDSDIGGFVQFGSFGYVRLPRNDPRLKMLLAELRAAGEEPTTRVERSYSAKDRDAALWLECTGGSTMVVTGRHPEQEWDMSGACPKCGAGAVPVAPLIVAFTGKKNTSGWTASCPYGHILVSVALAERLRRSRLTGFKALPVRTARSKTPDPNWKWLHITSAWPHHGKETAARSSVHHQTATRQPCDFNLKHGTCEPDSREGSASLRGGSPNVVLSHRAYRVLRQAGTRIQRLEPVFIDSDRAGKRRR